MSDIMINRFYSNVQQPTENGNAEQLARQTNERLQQGSRNAGAAQEANRSTPVSEAEKNLKAQDTVSTSLVRQAAPEIAPIESEEAARAQLEATKKMLLGDVFGGQNSMIHNGMLLQSQLMGMYSKELIQ